MKTMIRIAGAALMCLALSPSHAQLASPNKWYAELGYAQLNYKGSNDRIPATLKTSPQLLTGTVGYQFHPNLSVEGQLGLGAGKDGIKYTVAGTPVAVNASVEARSVLGVFVRPSLALSDRVELFARVGWAQTTMELSAPGEKASEKGGSMAYGLGANFKLTPNQYLQLNWTQYFRKTGENDIGLVRVKLDGVALVYGFRF